MPLLTDFFRRHLLLRRFAVDYGICVAFNVAVAFVVTYVMHVQGTFFESVVFSMCIGTLAISYIDGTRLFLWGEGRPSMAGMVFLIVSGAPLAFIGGRTLAELLLGMPVQPFAALFAPGGTSLVILTMLCCVIGALYYTNRERMLSLETEAARQRERAAAIEKQAMQAQLQLLQAQVEPHMLFNTLANLQGLIAVDAPRAQHMLEQLILYLRATLKSARAEQTTLAQEFALLDAYLGLMAVRMGARLAYELDLPPGLETLTLPPMLLQPLAENAIRHGLEPKVEGGRLHIGARLDAGRLHLSVTDTGLGLDGAQAATKGTGLGVANVRARLAAMFGEAASFTLSPNAPQGVRAELILPAAA